MSSLLASIGLYVYNGECFLEAALRSILNQTFTDFELIISDNASTDRTGDIAQSYAKGDDRVRYYRSEKNMGAGWNMRRVYELATCKYFKWSAADDVLEPEFLRLCVEILEREDDCVVAYAKPKEVDGNGAFIRNYDIPVKVDSNDTVARFREMILIDHNCYQIFGLIRMSALRQLPPHGIYVNADRVLLSRLSLLGRFCETPEALFSSRRHGGQSVAKLPVRLTAPRFRLTNRFGSLPCTEWWDPTKTRSLTFPEFRQLREYFLSIRHAPLSGRQKLNCYSLLLSWVNQRSNYLYGDLLIAADQMLYKWQTRSQSRRYSHRSKQGTLPRAG
jgi:glycosyltransferase involved in cell wall biosynthesis